MSQRDLDRWLECHLPTPIKSVMISFYSSRALSLPTRNKFSISDREWEAASSTDKTAGEDGKWHDRIMIYLYILFLLMIVLSFGINQIAIRWWPPVVWLFFTTAHHQIPWRELAKKTLSIVENQITSPFPLAHPSMTIAVCPIRSRSL